ncbi:uncharacterized protein LOC144141031 [Haemaphysalis longicornis]
MSNQMNTLDTVPRSKIFNPITYALREHYQHQLNNEALSGVKFNSEPNEDRQYLDIGCGTGAFTRSVLLPLSSPCRRLVAADITPSMFEFARKENSDDKIVYDLLDISSDQQVSDFAQKHGPFHRIYSFLCFMYAHDEVVAFRNVARLLSPGSECLISAAVFHPALDAWADVQRMPEWNSLVLDPAKVFANGVIRFHYTGSAAQIEKETRRRVTEAGLECLMCDVKSIPWYFEDIGSIFDKYSADFKLTGNVPPHKLEALKQDYTNFLRSVVTETPSGCAINVGIYRVLAKLH